MDHNAERDTIEEAYQRDFAEREGLEELAAQFRQEYREGMAADRLEQERRQFRWDIEGWDGDELRLYVAGFGLMILDQDAVRDLGIELLAQHQMHTDRRYMEDEQYDDPSR